VIVVSSPTVRRCAATLGFECVTPSAYSRQNRLPTTSANTQPQKPPVDSPEKPRRYRWLMPLAKAVIFAIVAFFVVRAIVDVPRQIAEEGLALSNVGPWWLALAALLFLLGQLPMVWFWHQTMCRLGQRPRFWDSVRAYYIGGLGKYVPGKAMVVVLRAGIVSGPRVDATVAALCVFIETLTMMAVGGFLAAVLVLFSAESPFGEMMIVYPLAIGLMLATGVPTIPPVFRFVVKMLRVSKANADVDQLLLRLDYKLMAQGWAANLLAWPIMGLSLWAALRAMPWAPGAEETLGGPLAQLPLLTASVALAVVAGFASMVPGGFGVRELVLNLLMKPTFGPLAIVSIILLRLAWLLSELGISSILYLCGLLSPSAAKPIADPASADTKT
jgi:uncharacterized membrane protein YbhN (UPF0104 family)